MVWLKANPPLMGGKFLSMLKNHLNWVSYAMGMPPIREGRFLTKRCFMRSKDVIGTFTLVFLLTFLISACAPSDTSLEQPLVGAEAGEAIPETASPVEKGICEDASANNLCEGLDIAYGEGYQEGCCTDYNICCQK